jgi:hypothetical protein
MAGMVLLATLYPFSGCEALYLTETARSEFIQMAMGDCLRRKADDPLMSQFPLPLYQAYCSCFATARADLPVAVLNSNEIVTELIYRDEAKRCYEKIKAEAERLPQSN